MVKTYQLINLNISFLYSWKKIILSLWFWNYLEENTKNAEFTTMLEKYNCEKKSCILKIILDLQNIILKLFQE